MLERLSDDEIMNEYVLCKIKRYNNRTKLQDESVADHTSFVCVFCLKIFEQIELTKDEERTILIMAILHDLPECETSDIPHNVKVKHPEIDNILKGIETDYYKENWNGYYDELYNSDSLCYEVMKLADSYSVYQFCMNEKTLGNESKENAYILSDSRMRIQNKIKIINKLLEERKEKIK